ncbi:MAG: single-stranded-DNA-specific exonuclease RecJ [Treponema sp.]|nr:single-stranded-DNA-specific exonuclease RecJ [Treponema sp.]
MANTNNSVLNWNKKNVTKQQAEFLCNNYINNKAKSLFGTNLSDKEITIYSQILSSILIRRNITEGNDILYYLEDDLRFQHSPFCFNSMEDAVERILQAQEDGEKVLIFGDKDVDGITSTAILYSYLHQMNIDVQWRLPVADDSYGLSMQAIDDFAAEEGTLIITVDCGISNFEEIKHANELGIDVIITDHHNPPENLPEAILIIDPKTEDSGYPFKEISGAAVAYKLVSALRFAQTDFYNAEICLMEVAFNPELKQYEIDCLKIRNLTKVKHLHEVIIPGKTSIYNLKLPYFLQGQLIYVWDSNEVRKILNDIFGSSVEFNLNDLRSEIGKVFPQLKNKASFELKDLSQIGKYIENEKSIINSLFNLYVTYCKRIIATKYPEQITDEKKDLQLVALAAIADIMPLQNENRIFVRNGILSMKKDKLRPGLSELFSRLKINIEAITAKDLSWTVTPALNAAGRLGQANISLELLLSENPKEREQLSTKIFELNEQRKDLTMQASYRIHDAAKESVKRHHDKLCVVVDEEINKGLTGNFAGRLMQDFSVPSIALTFCNDICVGSMRSCRGFIATTFLDDFGDFFINHGGHNYAAGFSFTKDKLNEFLEKAESMSKNITLEEENSDMKIDAEIPTEFLSPVTFKLLDILEPYGCMNDEIIIKLSHVKIAEGTIVGKKEPYTLKLLLDCGQYKFPAIFWNQGERLKKDIFVGNNYDILVSMSKNYFNGNITLQFEIIDIKQA